MTWLLLIGIALILGGKVALRIILQGLVVWAVLALIGIAWWVWFGMTLAGTL